MREVNKKQCNYDLIIIGGGMSGLIACGVAAHNGAKVLLLEKMRSVGRKVLISGKGRCNITNDSYASHHMKMIKPKPKFLKTAYKNFFKDDILQILKDQGVEVKTERGGRIFPASDKAMDVLKALESWAFTKNVQLETHAEVKRIIEKDGVFQGVEYLHSGKTKTAYANKVILSTGGKSYPATGSTGDGYKLAQALGHSIITPLPSLVPLETKGNLAEKLMGLSLKNVSASLWINGKKEEEEFGEMLFTHYGLSGPIILTLSRTAVLALQDKKKVEITIDLKPALDEQKLDQRLLRDLNEFGKKQIENVVKLWVPSKLINPLLEVCEISGDKKAHQISAENRKLFKKHLKSLHFEVTDHRSFKEAIITQGGISLDEIDAKTMESKIISGLYFAGEVINLDAYTGGYNFQIAYSTGSLAANSALL